jgi:Bacterial extracellular solute-binding protein
MPAKADIAKSSVTKAYADTLKRWMDKNPGITLKKSSTNVWDTKQLNTAISAGTAPTWYPGNVIGSWDNAQIRSSMSRGLAADVTNLVAKYDIQSQLADYAVAWWQHWKVDGKYYAGPFAVNAGTGIYYRRDWVQQVGMEEPKPGWTWEDFRKLAKALTRGKVKGAAFQLWGITSVVGANQFGLRTTIPSPSTSWHWRYDFLSDLDEWTNLVNIQRGMYNDDKSILSQPNWGDGDTTAAFIREDAAMMINTCIYFTQPPESAEGIVQLSTKHKKPLEELVGFVAQPVGTNGAFGNTQSQMDLVGFEPHLVRSPAVLDKAFSLYQYFVLGQGFIDQKVALYQATKDLRRVYDSVTPLNPKFLQIPGVPGSLEEAWGPKYVNMVRADAKIPLVPQSSWYFPPEKSAGLTTDATADAQNGQAFSKKDVKTIYTNWQNVQNQQAASLSSSIPQADFAKAARAYYAAHSDFWQKNAPDFYANTFKPWYERKILPVLIS